MSEKKTILIIGSEPFGEDETNPSLEIASQLDGLAYKDYVFRFSSFPVNRKQLIASVESVIEEHQPSIIIGVGLADNRNRVSLERIAVNVADFPEPDNAGYLALNEILVPEGPAAYFSTLPIRACVKSLRDAGIPAHVSNTAGTFCCNMTMYAALHYVASTGLQAKAGFVHIPYTPELIAVKGLDRPSMSFDRMKYAIELVAKAAVDNDEDIEMIAGTFS